MIIKTAFIVDNLLHCEQTFLFIDALLHSGELLHALQYIFLSAPLNLEIFTIES